MEEDWRITLSCLESPDPSFVGTQKVFTQSPINIGRAENSDMVIPDLAVSRNHAILRITADYTRVFITDMSTHGTEVSGKVVPKGRGSGFTLENGDTIKLGETVLQYELKLKTSVQSTMVGKIDRSFLDKPPEPVVAEKIEEPVIPLKTVAPAAAQKNFNPIYLGIIIISLALIIYLLIKG
ncbi:FHA domain-containing protein [bacterium]|nr:FHA domain-containing protein [bacterium]